MVALLLLLVLVVAMMLGIVTTSVREASTGCRSHFDSSFLQCTYNIPGIALAHNRLLQAAIHIAARTQG